MRLSEVRLEDLPSYQIGLEKGLRQGLEQGIMKKAIEASLIAIKEFGIKPEVVAKKFGVSIEKIMERLKDEIENKWLFFFVDKFYFFQKWVILGFKK